MALTAATKQTQAIDAVNRLISASAQLRALYDTVAQLTSQTTNQGLAALLAALPTAAPNADGSLGEADATPVSDHPLDPRVLVGLNRACLVSELTETKAALTELLAFMDGAAVATKARKAIVDVLIGG